MKGFCRYCGTALVNVGAINRAAELLDGMDMYCPVCGRRMTFERYCRALHDNHPELRGNGQNYIKGKGGKFEGSRPGGGSGSGAAGNLKNGIDKSAESDIIKSNTYHDSGKDEIPITEEAIERVPKLNVFDDDKINQAIQDYQKEILRDMMNEPLGTEESIVFPLSNPAEKIKTKGIHGEHGVNIPILDKPYVSIHNHPSCGTVSYRDTSNFTQSTRRNEVAVFVVGNNGKSYGARKSADYNFSPSKWTAFNDYFRDKAKIGGMNMFWNGVDENEHGIIYQKG